MQVSRRFPFWESAADLFRKIILMLALFYTDIQQDTAYVFFVDLA
jgi:hypothetical protein